MNVMRALLTISLLTAIAATAAAQVQVPPQWASGTSFAGGGLVRASNGNFYRALRTNVGHDPVADNHSYWELFSVRANLTLSVAASKATFTSLKQAWAMVQSATIASTATVTIKVSSNGGSYHESFTAPMSLNQQCGSQISISGDSGVEFDFPGNMNGFSLTGGHTFGGISGFNIYAPSAGYSVGGINVDGASSLLAANSIKITHFGIGMFVQNHSTLISDSCTLFEPVLHGIYTDTQSHTKSSSLVLQGDNVTGVGVNAVHNSYVDVSYGKVAGCTGNGVDARYSSTIVADFCTANNLEWGFFADTGSVIQASNSTSTNNTTGYRADLGSKIYAGGATVSGNATDFVPPLNTESSEMSMIYG